MNKICTSLEQSKKLLELGIDVNTADMIYYWFGDFKLNDEWYELNLGTYRVNDKDIPSWSFAALMDLLPEHVTVSSYLKQDYYRFEITPTEVLFGDSCHTEKSDNKLDAVFQMVCWLKENGKI